jgi:DNA polymerase-3 subunit epsilon
MYFLLKDDLYKFALNKNLIKEGSYTKGNIIDAIEKNLDQVLALEALKEFKHTIGYTATETEGLLRISKSERVKWTKKNLLNVTGTYEVRAYGTYLDCPIYDGVQIIELMEKGVDELRNSIKQPTEKQLAALERARTKSLENRTCRRCGRVCKSKNSLDSDKLCSSCSQVINALKCRKYWLDHKDEYVLLDVETTGLYSNDEIVQIGIIDLDGNVLMDQLVRPTQKIPEDAMRIHGITDEMVKDCPTWKVVYLKVKKLLKGKTIIAYNASFDTDMIRNSCRKYNIIPESLEYECLMYNTMDVWGSERWISLQRAIDAEDINIIQDHSAVGDCNLCLELIKVTVENQFKFN